MKNDRKGALNVFLFADFQNLELFFRGTGKKNRIRVSSYGTSYVNGKGTLNAAVRDRAERNAHAAKVFCALGILYGHSAPLGN